MKNRLIIGTLALSLFGSMLSTTTAFATDMPDSTQSQTTPATTSPETVDGTGAASTDVGGSEVTLPAETTPTASPSGPAPAPVTQESVLPEPLPPIPETTAPASKRSDTVEPALPEVPAVAEIIVKGAIKVRWDSLKAENGALGVPLWNEKSYPGYIVQAFKGGYIYVDSATGTHHILASSAIGKTWYSGGKDAASGYGIPISEVISSADGSYQKFSSGKWIFTTGLTVGSTAGIGSRWLANGGLKVLGAPTTNEKCGQRDGGCFQNFKKTTIFWSPKAGAHAVHGGILTRYKANGMQASPLGSPTGPETCNLPQRGCAQNFQTGQILWVGGTGAFSVVDGPIRNHFSRLGSTRSFLKFPRGEQVCGQPDNGCYQNFQGGVAYNAKSTGAASIHNGKLMEGFKRRSWHTGILGFPKGQEVCGQPNSGCYQDFGNGRLWSSRGHALSYMTRGGLGSSYTAKGGPRSYLGYPISDERCSGGQCVQTFVGGYIGWGNDGAGGYYNMSQCQNLNNGKSRYTTGGAKRVLLTFTNGYNQAHATVIYCKRIAGIYVTDWKSDGYVGATGFKPPGVPSGPTRNLFSPTGSFTVTEAFGLGNPGTKLPYRTLNPRSRWGGNPWTPTYNKYHESNSWVGWDENMWYFATRAQHDYRQGAVINYNRPNIVQNAGFAIFLHENKVPTAGCISVDDWAMVDFLRKATPGDRIIMGVQSALFK